MNIIMFSGCILPPVFAGRDHMALIVFLIQQLRELASETIWAQCFFCLYVYFFVFEAGLYQTLCMVEANLLYFPAPRGGMTGHASTCLVQCFLFLKLLVTYSTSLIDLELLSLSSYESFGRSNLSKSQSISYKFITSCGCIVVHESPWSSF